MSLAEDAVKRINRQELIDLALTICNIDSAGPTEARVAEYIYEWLCTEGFKARKTGLLADRFNVIGTLPGTGDGCSLIFNSHMDTAAGPRGVLYPRDATAVHFRKPWMDGRQPVGEAIVSKN